MGQRQGQRVGHLAVVFLGLDRVVGELAPRAVLLELGRAFLEAAGTPELVLDGVVLLHHLVLLEQLGELVGELLDLEADELDEAQGADRLGLHAGEPDAAVLAAALGDPLGHQTRAAHHSYNTWVARVR